MRYRRSEISPRRHGRGGSPGRCSASNGQRYFTSKTLGRSASPRTPDPPSLAGVSRPSGSLVVLREACRAQRQARSSQVAEKGEKARDIGLGDSKDDLDLWTGDGEADAPAGAWRWGGNREVDGQSAGGLPGRGLGGARRADRQLDIGLVPATPHPLSPSPNIPQIIQKNICICQRLKPTLPPMTFQKFKILEKST